MPEMDIKVLQTITSLENLCNEFAKTQKQIKYLVNGQIDFDNIRARSIKTENLEAGSITANEIAAGTITADKMDVAELSAISANLGKVIAGILIGAYISTADGTYPRIDFNSTGQLLVAYLDAGNHLEIIPDLLGLPALRFTKASVPVGTLSAGGALSLSGAGIEIDILSNLDVNLVSTTGNVAASSSGGFIADIPTAINNKATKGLAGTKTYYVANSSGGAVTRKLTFTDGVLTSET